MALGDFFSQQPMTMADVPVAAMRSMLRPAPLPTPSPPALQGRPNMTPPPDMRSTQAQQLPPMEVPRLQASNEWGDLTKRAVGLAKDFQEKEKPKSGVEDFILNMDKQIADLKAQRAAPAEAVNSADPNAPRKPATADDATGDYFARNASFESGNDRTAVNKTSGASGLFQFMPSTWRGIMQEDPSLGLTHEGIFDVDQQKKAMQHYTGKSSGILSGMLGRKPTGGELYLLHLLGHAGGPTVLKDIDAPITYTIGTAAYNSNPFLKQYKTGRDLVAGLNQKFGG